MIPQEVKRLKISDGEMRQRFLTHQERNKDGITNALAEGLNSKIMSIKRRVGG